LTLRLQLILASASPRRKELLSIFGIPFTVLPSGIDETPLPGELPEPFVVRVARDKGEEVAGRAPAGTVVLSADTIVTVDNEILGKPTDLDDARRMLRKLSGRRHAVLTAVSVIDRETGEQAKGLDLTDVWFDPVSEEQIEDYLKREDVLDKAGAYAIQGFAAAFIPRIEGNYFNVMGLPLPLVYRLLQRFFPLSKS
jgi:septum formation protein